MKAIAGTDIGGRVELPARLSSEDELELWEAMEDIRRGDFVDGEALLNELHC